MGSNTFQIQMLGGFSVRRGGVKFAVPSRSKKLCLLLAFLIAERNRTVPLEELTSLLWEEVPPGANASNSLKALLHRARTGLDQLGEGTGRTLLLSREGGCQWNPEVLSVIDAGEFVRLCREGTAGADNTQLNLGLKGLALYQGNFLPGLEEHPWAASKAGKLRQLWLQTASDILPLLAARERWQEAAELAGQAMDLEPCQEELCRRRMEALLCLGHAQRAAQVYEDFQEQLLAQLGVMPSDELRTLYRQTQKDSDPRAISPATLLERLREPPQPGALLCDYDFFRIICHSLVRMADRGGGPLHVALFTVGGVGENPLPRHSLDRCMDNLQGIILSHLRQGDAVTRCSASQFVLLLPQASFENAQWVCTRITRAFSRQFPHSPAVLHHSVLPLISDV